MKASSDWGRGGGPLQELFGKLFLKCLGPETDGRDRQMSSRPWRFGSLAASAFLLPRG